MTTIKLKVMPWELSVCKIKDPEIPNWAKQSRFLNYVTTHDEVSLVCESKFVPSEVKSEKEWGCIKVDEVLDFSLVGILAQVTSILASQSISIFVISTFDTDYILMHKGSIPKAIEALKEEGYNLS